MKCSIIVVFIELFDNIGAVTTCWSSKFTCFYYRAHHGNNHENDVSCFRWCSQLFFPFFLWEIKWIVVSRRQHLFHLIRLHSLPKFQLISSWLMSIKLFWYCSMWWEHILSICWLILLPRWNVEIWPQNNPIIILHFDFGQCHWDVISRDELTNKHSLIEQESVWLSVIRIQTTWIRCQFRVIKLTVWNCNFRNENENVIFTCRMLSIDMNSHQNGRKII